MTVVEEELLAVTAHRRLHRKEEGTAAVVPVAEGECATRRGVPSWKRRCGWEPRPRSALRRRHRPVSRRPAKEEEAAVVAPKAAAGITGDRKSVV